MSAGNTDFNPLYAAEANFSADISSLPNATLDDISLDWPCSASDAAAVYDEWGCVLVRGLLADMAEAIYRDGALMAKRVQESNYEKSGTALIMPGGETGKDKQIMLFCPTYSVAASHFQAATDSHVADLLEGLIGPNIELYGQGMYMYKEPGGGMEKSLHQDAPYFYHRDHSFCTAFVHVVPTNEKNGCLRVVPGSHKLGLLGHVDLFSHLALPPEKFPIDKALQVHAQPGDVVLFSYLTVHGSDNNWSDRVRPALCMQYRSATDRQIWEGAANVERLGLPLETNNRASTMMLRGVKLPD